MSNSQLDIFYIYGAFRKFLERRRAEENNVAQMEEEEREVVKPDN